MAKLDVLPKRLDELVVTDPKCSFRINIDVLNEAFGIGRSMYAKAMFPDTKDGFFGGTKPGDRFKIWMPKLYGNSSEWKNVISEDGTEIYEVAEGDRHEDWISEDSDLSIIRIVFVKESPKSPYVFAGVFVNEKMDYCNHTYRRIATRVRLLGMPVNRIELIDDNR